MEAYLIKYGPSEKLSKPNYSKNYFILFWCHLVEEFTARKLTFPDNRVYAVSGITDASLQRRNEQYLAGIWKYMLLGGLLWYVTDRAEALLWRSPGNRAPTKSWLSVN